MSVYSLARKLLAPFSNFLVFSFENISESDRNQLSLKLEFQHTCIMMYGTF